MPEHFTRNTVSASFFCNKCGKFTQHRIDDARKGPCLDCIARLDAAHDTKPAQPDAVQENLFVAAPPLTAEEARAGAEQIDKNLAELFPKAANHTEILSPADPEWGNRHKRQRYRNEGDESPWDGDYAIYDERCPKCRADAIAPYRKNG